MITALYDGVEVRIPDGARTLDGFRKWAASDDFPETGTITYFQQEIIADMSPEKAETHNKPKTEITRVLSTLVKELDLGEFYADRIWLTNDKADLSNEADATFASWESLEGRRIRLVVTENDDGIEMQGSPDWVLEVVSRSSVRKDTTVLPVAYHLAGVREYWLIDVRGKELVFTVRRWQPDGFEIVRPREEWVWSDVFQREFRFQRKRNRIGGWSYTLHVRNVT